MTDIDRSAPPPRLLSRPREFSVCRLCYKIGRSLVLASTASIKRPVLVPVSAHGSANDRNCALASTMRLTMPNRSKVLRARRSIRVTVTTSPGARALRSLRSSRRSLCAPVTFSR